MTIDRDALKAIAADHGWALELSCPTLDQYTLTPAAGGSTQREVAVYFAADGAIVDAYESFSDEHGRFLGRGIAAEQIAATMSREPQEAVPVPTVVAPGAVGAAPSANPRSR